MSRSYTDHYLVHNDPTVSLSGGSKRGLMPGCESAVKGIANASGNSTAFIRVVTVIWEFLAESHGVIKQTSLMS